jgi:putative oxidoreductase
VRRLFSTFARGAPGAGLLLLRIASGAAAIVNGLRALSGGLAIGPAVPGVLNIAAGALLLPGLWTPVAGFLLAFSNLWEIFSGRAAVSFPDIVTGSAFLLAAIGAALGLLGPGAWSVDARLFGWRRIDVRDRTR